MSSSIVYGDGLDDVKDCMLGVVTRRDRGEGCSCNRPVILGSILIIWLFSVSVALIVVASKYQNLSVVSLSSRLDQVDRLHLEKHSNTNSRIDTVSSQHRMVCIRLQLEKDIPSILNCLCSLETIRGVHRDLSAGRGISIIFCC
ncbi:uncharacterized protein LOC111697784 isoform X2 [Eurytemora carolleeae]|uniref:uncharacterized protein LOC111697784 isoform X2 n=1 Tax=Eurytemora carolleeae TaxID=1294199 RepID=UPI000C76D7A6|nr:uncharacterized protein LOC111697784 isoform X2 [Eurytemora carolleeae]|eukprot:XP_023323676.1 uncharacterized protein LOC111697784 isoform X2 [Eurytemora affinis]